MASSVTKVPTDDNRAYFGESICQKGECKKKAYYMSRGVALCGMHSRGDAFRKDLPKNPNKDANELKAMESKANLAEQKALENQLLLRGHVISRKLGMMKPLPIVDGYYLVLPNVRAKAKSGQHLIWAMPSLSPMVLGPVEHKQPDLPPCHNIENFHQFNKVFANEIEEETGKKKQIWYQRRIKGYSDQVPHRHKLGDSKASHMKNAGISAGGNANACRFSVYVDPSGNEIEFGYTESRVFYCTFYERLASKTTAYNKLIDAVWGQKKNIVIAGYDARNLEESDTINSEVIQGWYDDPKFPFGHEMVLLSMIVLHNNKEEYPWRKAAQKLGFEI